MVSYITFRVDNISGDIIYGICSWFKLKMLMAVHGSMQSTEFDSGGQTHVHGTSESSATVRRTYIDLSTH